MLLTFACVRFKTNDTRLCGKFWCRRVHVPRPSDAVTLFSFSSSQSVDKEILDILPKIKEAKKIVGLMDRDTLTFDVALQRTEDEVTFLGVQDSDCILSIAI